MTSPQKWRICSIPKELRDIETSKLNGDHWVMLHHSPDFYSNFATLLKMAEQLEVYILPSSPNKYSARNLKSFLVQFWTWKEIV